MPIILVVSMFLAAVIFSMLGQGGGILYTPIQFLAGTDFHTAATTSLFLIMVMSLSASLVFRQANKIDWPLAMVLETASIIGGYTGGRYSTHVPSQILCVVFAFVVVIAAIFMMRPVKPVKLRQANPGGLIWRRTLDNCTYDVNLGIALPLSLLAGVVSGLAGVGGGVLKIPMMVLLFGIPMDIAIGSSAFMVGLTAAAGFAGHLTSGHWDWKQSLLLAAAVFVGAQVGSRISIRLDKKVLKRYFGWFLLVVAGIMLVRAFWGG